jgi:thioredoxin reductase (NADPH)
MPKSLAQNVRNVIIIGSGPAGLTASLYASRGNLKPLLIEGVQAGGQLMITTDVENFPGFAEGIQGPKLMQEMRKQAERFGTEFIQGDVSRVDLKKSPFLLEMEDGTQHAAKALIISTGASAKLLGLESEMKLMGRGVSACATCDGFFFRGKKVVVIGGGDTAVEEAIFLTKFATKVSIIHRRDQLRASKIMQDRAMANPKIAFIWDTAVADVLGAEVVTGVRLHNLKTNRITEMKCDGVFVAIGHEPNTKLFSGQLKMDERGYILTKKETTETSVTGVFAAGDVQDHRYRQAITAAGTGCMAAMDAEKYLEHHHS